MRRNLHGILKAKRRTLYSYASNKKIDINNGQFAITPETDLSFSSHNRVFISEYRKLWVLRHAGEPDLTIPCNTMATVAWNGKTSELGNGTYIFTEQEKAL